MVAFALVLFIVKVLLMAIIPDQAGWVTTKLMAAKYRQDKIQANEITNEQASDAIKIERQQVRSRITKMNAGIKQLAEQEVVKKKVEAATADTIKQEDANATATGKVKTA